jgi:hypothetical protein
MKKLIAALVVCLVPLALVACGGDDDKGPSKADYIEEADALCAKSDVQTDKIFEESFEDPQKPQPEEAQAAIKEALPVVKDNLEKLKDLEKPKDDEEEIETIYASVETGIESLDEASANPDQSLAALLAEPFAQANKLAKDYGMNECGDDS